MKTPTTTAGAWHTPTPSLCEVWKPILGADNYEVSNLGRVRSLYFINRNAKIYRPRILKERLVNGYPSLSIRVGGKNKNTFTHVCVCEAFHGPRPPGKQASHRNGIRTDARAENLRWLTPKENEHEKRAHGTILLGAQTPSAVLSDEKVREIKQAPRSAARALAAKFGVHLHTVQGIMYGKSWKWLKA